MTGSRRGVPDDGPDPDPVNPESDVVRGGMSANPSTPCQRLVLDIWHPNCWTLEVTEICEAGLLGHGVYDVSETSIGRFTAFADTTAAIDELVDAIRASPLTERVRELPGRHTAGDWRGTPVHGVAPGNATRGLLVRYRSVDSISGPLLSCGLIPDAPTRIRNGREEWRVLFEGERDTIATRLDEVRRESNATINVVRISTPVETSAALLPEDPLSERQREAYELARDRGYYEWPRNVSGVELADEWDVSKATFLEHLRKAESKLLGGDAGLGG